MVPIPEFQINPTDFFSQLIPPPRYENCRYENYYPNHEFATQEKTKKLLQKTVERLNRYVSSNRIKQYFIRKHSHIRGIYLDGGFGIGKTHLLTSIYHEFSGKKMYASFSELMYMLSYFGMQDVCKRLADTKLICIDEFELDDPGNTMKASNFIKQMVATDTFIVTTSNTVPGELGKGRFNAKNFEQEIGQISKVFKTVTIEGNDYRQKDAQEDHYQLFPSTSRENDPYKISLSELSKVLEKLPQIYYEHYARSTNEWRITDLKPFQLQDTALRFTHFIDKLYDSNIALTLEFETNKTFHLFPEEYLNGSYQKKYKRCLSRLHELTRD